VTGVSLKLITGAPAVPNDPKTTLAYKITARRGGYVVTPDILEPYDFPDRITWGQLETQMALGSTADGSATCARRTFPSWVDGSFDHVGMLIPCAKNGRGTRITCETARPIGPCRVGEPRDVLVCEVLAVAAAQEAYKAAHDTYFQTTAGCASLPGYMPTPDSGVSCTIYATSSVGFSIAATNANAPAYTCIYTSTDTPALDCF
jgi:hypothetical protein